MKANKLIKTLLPLAVITLLSGAAQAAVIYANDNFEGEAIGEFSAAANTTSFVNTDPTLTKVYIVATTTSTGSTLQDPAGDNSLRIRGNLDKSATLTNAMTLDDDNVTSIDVSFKLYFNDADSRNIGRLLYSKLGDFSDEVEVQTFDPEAVADPGNYIYGITQWYAATVVIDSMDVDFANTAKIRFAQSGGGANSTHFFLDDIVITGNQIPEPTTTALLGLGGLALILRRRK